MIPRNIKEILTENGLKALEFKEGSTPTAATAAEKIGVEVDQIAKSLLFKGKDGHYFMIVCTGGLRTSTKKLKNLTGSKTRMARPEELMEVTGFKPGEVCPFGVKGVEIYLDESLKAWDTFYPAAGTDSSGVPVTWDQLLKITGAGICDVGMDEVIEIPQTVTEL
ncbi:MAG: YbaK/EbsC family protein [Spirochaetales bacterium]|nr:YbaK/EbsC family protein [Spirochaetales bacterium]